MIFCKKVVTPAATRGKGSFCGSWSFAKTCQTGCNPPAYPNILVQLLFRPISLQEANVVQPYRPLFITIKKWKRTKNPKLNFWYLFSGISLVYLSLFGCCSVLGIVIFSSKSCFTQSEHPQYKQISLMCSFTFLIGMYLSWNTIDKYKSKESVE